MTPPISPDAQSAERVAIFQSGFGGKSQFRVPRGYNLHRKGNACQHTDRNHGAALKNHGDDKGNPADREGVPGIDPLNARRA